MSVVRISLNDTNHWLKKTKNTKQTSSVDVQEFRTLLEPATRGQSRSYAYENMVTYEKVLKRLKLNSGL